MTFSALTVSPLVSVRVKSPFSPVIAFTSALSMTLTLCSAGLLVPGAEHRLALAGVEIQVRAQHQLARRRHDVLALLIFVDRVGEVVGLFEQDVGDAEPRRAGRGAEAGGARTDDGDAKTRAQLSSP